MSGVLSDAPQREAALDLSRHVLAMAPAGSGKTGLLVGRLLRALAQVDEPEQVVAITFTNKAAAEIRHRAISLLQRARTSDDGAEPHLQEALAGARAVLARDAERGWHLLDQPERLRATTIDAFSAQIATQQPLLSGLGGRVGVAEDAWPLYADAAMRVLADLEEGQLADADRQALQTVLRLADNRIDRLLPALAELLSRREQWLRHAMGDATWEIGEAAVLERLVSAGLARFESALDPAFRTELTALLQTGSTLAEPLQWAADLVGWPAPIAANLTMYRLLAAQLVTGSGTLRKSGGINVKTGFGPGQPHTARMKALLDSVQDDATLSAAAVQVLRLPDAAYPDSLQTLRRALLRVMRTLAVYLLQVFGERGQTDFAQISISAIFALRPEGGYGDALLSADRRIRHLLVDEMQDTSESQVELLRHLTHGWQAGDGRSLFLVGDPQQSIYAFRKAEVRLFLELWERQQLGDLSLHCIQLNANFRSDAAVVSWFNRAFSTIFPQRADASLGVVPFAASVAQRASSGGGVDIVALPADAEALAAEQAAAAAAELIAQGSVAILGRARTHLAPVIRALRARGLTPACQDIDPLSTQPAVRDYIALARALWQPADRLHWAVLLRAPFVGLSWADLIVLSAGQTRLTWPERIASRLEDPALSADGRARLERLLGALHSSAESATLRADLAERCEALWYALNGPGTLAPGEFADLQAAMRLLRAQTRDGGIHDLEALERALERLYAQPRAGQIQVMTIHKAKGLEFDHVLLVGAHRRSRSEDKPLWHLRSVSSPAGGDADGGGELLVPKPPDALAQDDPAWRLYDYVHAEHSSARAHESLRLLYVAVTRARRSLRLYLCADVDDKGQPRFASGSFAALLAPVINADFLASADVTAPAPAPPAPPPALPPRAPRLPLGEHLPVDDPGYRPQETRTLRPSEAVLNAAEDKREDISERAEGELEARLIGTLYHQALERIGEEGIQAWHERSRSATQALSAGFQRLGLPAPRVAAAVTRVLELVKRTLESAEGQWLLAPKRWARNEYHLAGYRDGRWLAAVIDRCFEDDDGSLWIIDYKAAAHPLPPTAVNAYVEGVRVRYREQLDQYRGLLQLLQPGRRVRTALYLPEPGMLLEIEAGDA